MLVPPIGFTRHNCHLQQAGQVRATEKVLSMTKKILIDAQRHDETRVVLLNNDIIEDIDYETSHRKQLRGNVYLAKVTRVEPSLQAAFVEYGGNRQGFLAFSEIHPDYYRIPIEDREKLLAEERANAESGEDDSEGFDADDERMRKKRFERFRRHYTIQEVISRRQILLIQVVKEERGTKGAAVTTYLSLAGRYCVLMPNTYHRGGISRKISGDADRKKLKKIIADLNVPTGMAVIVRTAGAKRTKAEITRDHNYLMRQWDEIRKTTLESEAPALIHEEANLIKRAVRDYYTAEVDEVIVEGHEAYLAARTHMKNLMPSHVKKVIEHTDKAQHLLQTYQVEPRLAEMHLPEVTLKSGGYIVINQTEALVAIDVNSGKATQLRNIEETALKTNLEAAVEIARQLKLRDLSGLIVIDFIDMEVNRNRHTIEAKLNEALKQDRARVQTGSISQFGLLEMSRQRLRPSLSESMADPCPHCQGSGRIQSMEGIAMAVLGQIESEIARKSRARLVVGMATPVALYILNHNRAAISALEDRHKMTIILEPDAHLLGTDVRFDGETASAPNAPTSPNADDKDGKPKRRRRNRRGGKSNRPDEAKAEAKEEAVANEEAPKPKRGRRKKTDDAVEAPKEDAPKPTRGRQKKAPEKTDDAVAASKEDAPKPAAKSSQGRRKKAPEKPDNADSTETPAPKRASKKAPAKADTKATRENATSADIQVVDVNADNGNKKKQGWWSR